MNNRTSITNLGEIPEQSFFIKEPSGKWIHMPRNGDEPEAGAELYEWSENTLHEASYYEKVLPSEPLIENDQKGKNDLSIIPVPVRVSDGTIKSSKDKNCILMLDRISMYLHHWIYLLKSTERNLLWAKTRLEYIQEAERKEQVILPLSLSTLLDNSQRIIPHYPPFVKTADYNIHLRNCGATLKQPNGQKSDLVEWEQDLLITINQLTKAYRYASLIASGKNKFGQEVRERIRNAEQGKRQVAYQFSSEICIKMLSEIDPKYRLSLIEELIVAQVTYVNPADFIIRKEALRFHYELIILSSKICNGEQFNIITEGAVRLLNTWKQYHIVPEGNHDMDFLRTIWMLLSKPFTHNKFSSHHIRRIAEDLDVLGPMEYLQIETQKQTHQYMPGYNIHII